VVALTEDDDLTEIEQDLAALREAARGREWNRLQDTLKRLLANFEPLQALEIAAVRVVDFLPTFEHYYPEATWARELLLTVVNYASAPNELPENSVSQFPSPGCGNFVVAVLDLARTAQPKYTVFERYSHVTNAIANIILADLSQFYYSQHPDAWERLTAYPDEIDPATGLSFRQQVPMQFWLDTMVAARDTAAWLTIADEVEEKLKA
jgi:hypothetical protein